MWLSVVEATIMSRVERCGASEPISLLLSPSMDALPLPELPPPPPPSIASECDSQEAEGSGERPAW